jgi:hypothetical protein
MVLRRPSDAEKAGRFVASRRRDEPRYRRYDCVTNRSIVDDGGLAVGDTLERIRGLGVGLVPLPGCLAGAGVVAFQLFAMPFRMRFPWCLGATCGAAGASGDAGQPQ